MKIGILGGTFNPIHNGHLILAKEAKEKLGLDKIIFVPANLAPHKDNLNLAAAGDRLAMISLAIGGNKDFAVSDMETKRGGRSYSIDTVKELKSKYPSDELYFIVGSDLLNYLDDWRDLGEVIKKVKFIVATRPGYPLEKIPSYIQTIAIDAVDISAFGIRNLIKENKSFKELLPAGVFDYINMKGLYR